MSAGTFKNELLMTIVGYLPNKIQQDLKEDSFRLKWKFLGLSSSQTAAFLLFVENQWSLTIKEEHVKQITSLGLLIWYVAENLCCYEEWCEKYRGILLCEDQLPIDLTPVPTVEEAEGAVRTMLRYMGEDPRREGLLETPRRVVKSWGTIYGGYKLDPKDMLKTFKDGACDEMVLLKDIEFYSSCEHHLIPFFGKVSIAYIPNGTVIGISKLARIMEVFARRAQIQERIGQQITEFLMEELGAKGAACVVKAQHLCMVARGVEKQSSVMVTSSLKGVFKDHPETRSEFMNLIN